MRQKDIIQTLVSVVTLLLVLSSCARNEVEETQGAAVQFGQNRFSFRSIDPTASDNLRSMGVFSSITEGDWSDQNLCNYAYNLSINRTAGGSTPWNYSPLLYFPSTTSGKKLSFFAYSPYNPSGASFSNNQQKGAPLITFSTIADPVSTTSLDNQTDLLVASSILNRTDGSGKVLFDFDHALTQIRFEAKLDNAIAFPQGVSCYISEIVLTEIAHSGTAKMGKPIVWQTNTPNQTITLNTNSNTLAQIPLNNSAYQSVLNTTPLNRSFLLVMPQTFTSSSAAKIDITFSFIGASIQPLTLSQFIHNISPEWHAGQSIVFRIDYNGLFIPVITSNITDWQNASGSGNITLD